MALVHGEPEAIQDTLKPQSTTASNTEDSMYASDLATGNCQKDSLVAVEVFHSCRECSTRIETRETKGSVLSDLPPDDLDELRWR